nr:PREDICTED: uncharacterized protein LOC103314795 isoform X1 [Tribolium castaneum]XP_015840012.1 PREDICTED: uncharacterized protein LOC103314795 isoform X1 [Tribolium castaneum]|eukprot:XP_008199932.1 PREDICTED: uncharacterized protein LOC103314795 isoform X1 [Tribolium castaneum]
MLRPFLVTEKRINFHNFQLKLGKQNATQGSIMENVIEDNTSDKQLNEISSYFQHFFNSSIEILYFEKLGRKENGKEWTDLLGAVVNEEVDLGLDTIIKTEERYYDMAFTHNILTSMRNIYIKHQPSNELRDIYLIPFGTKLILFVMITGFTLCLLMTIINKVTNKITENGNDSKDNSFGEATICCIGIFTMQGSLWSPSTYSGNIILITSLAFALVIFNSYSAFITSILSVELSSIRSVEDLLESNYNIGYVKNSQDEVYLRSMNDTQLQQIYLRGYLYNTVGNVTEGLYKSYKGHYGFFASTNIARKELQRINNYKCNYEIMEIPIMKTKNTIAFPLARKSHYKKVIDLSIMRMYETGIYKYFYSMVVPTYSKCDERRIFRSAHLPDLSSAFGILIIGVKLSVIIIIAECLWKRKRVIYLKIKKNWLKTNLYHRGRQRNERIISQKSAL